MMQIVDELLLGKDLTTSEAERVFNTLLSRKTLDERFAKTLLVLLRKKGEHSDELTGLVRAIRKLEKPITKPRYSYLVDGCGTGGDGTNTFNISTIASIVAAGAGAQVAKHGNRSISSRSGSADLLEALGVNIVASRERMLKALKKCNLAYFHAPLYHHTFKVLQPVRRELTRKLKIRTIFNIVGPLVNPLRPNKQAIGIFQEELVPIVAETVKKLGFKHVLIFRSKDGMDELSTTAESSVIEVSKGKMKSFHISPKQLGFRLGKRKELSGGNPKRNRKIAIEILSGKKQGTKRDVVILNAAAILYTSGKAKNLKQGIELARQSIDSKSAQRALKQLARISHGTG